MDILASLIPIALCLGAIGLGAFIWSLKSGQFEDLDGAAMRILNDDETDQEKTPDKTDQTEASSRGKAKPSNR